MMKSSRSIAEQIKEDLEFQAGSQLREALWIRLSTGSSLTQKTSSPRAAL